MKNAPHHRPVSTDHVSISPRELLAEGRRLFHAGLIQEAALVLNRVLGLEPKSTPAIFLLGLIALKQGDMTQAESYFRRCIRIDPRHAGAQVNLGNLLMDQGRYQAALACYRSALASEPRHFAWHFNLGRCLRALGQRVEAIQAYQLTLKLRPDFFPAAIELGETLWETGQYAQAESICLPLTRCEPKLLSPRLILAHLRRLEGRYDEARSLYAEVLGMNPRHIEALLGMARLLMLNKDLGEAERLILRAGAGPRGPRGDTLAVAAELLARQGDYPRAIDLLGQAMTHGVSSVQSYLLLAFWHGILGDRVRAVAALEQGLKRHGDQEPSLQVALIYNLLCLCDWRHFPERLKRVQEYMRTPPPGFFVQPFIALLIPGVRPVDLRRAILSYAVRYQHLAKQSLPPPPPPSPHGGGPLRIGYLSADFHEHATAYLTAAIFEQHRPDRVETFAYSFGPKDEGPTLQRLRRAFQHFKDIHELDDRAAADLIRSDGVQILVDLKGYTLDARTEILALRPAPIQINWLGFPGTMAVDFIDYIIVDETTVPAREAEAFAEALAFLPHTYAPIDPSSPIAPIPSRIEAGLPETGFVFCCFNNPRKITPDFFRCWCRLLAVTPDAVLWLFADQEPVITNLRHVAAQQGVEPSRILFASPLSRPDHLARLSLADLVLDTLPYNAHTTTADALLAGVPVLTCLGDSFAGRVAASLLRAVGLDAMITLDLAAYEAKARDLASRPEAIGQLRAHLAAARASQPYFDTAGFSRDLEALYQRMWERHRRGLRPAQLPLLSHAPG